MGQFCKQQILLITAANGRHISTIHIMSSGLSSKQIICFAYVRRTMLQNVKQKCLVLHKYTRNYHSINYVITYCKNYINTISTEQAHLSN